MDTLRTHSRSALFAIVVAASVGLAAPSFAGQTNSGGPNANTTYRVAGIAVSAKTGEPLAQARVTLVSNKNADQAASLTTNEDGRFVFTGVGAGKYSLQGAKRGYIPAAYEQHEQFSTAIVTGKEIDSENLRLKLMPLAMLSGTVLDENGEGVRNAQVRLYVESHRGGMTRVVRRGGASTDDQGTFEITSLGPGKYYVCATASPWYALSQPITATQPRGAANSVDRSLDVAYPTTFFGGSTESDGAEPIVVEAGDHAQAEIHLTPVPALHLVFHLPEHDAQLGFQWPTLEHRIFDAFENVAASGTQSSEGMVELSGFPPGKYTARTPDASGQLVQRTEVELKEGTQELNTERGEPLARVKISIKLPDGDSAPRQMNIGLQDAKGNLASFRNNGADGFFVFDSLPAGKYRVRVFSSEKAYWVTQMSSRDTKMLAAEFNVRPGESQEWSASLAVGKTSVEGFVRRQGKAASGVMVVLIPADPDAHQDLFRRDESDLDGSFVVRNVVPGSYTIVAIEDAWGFDWSKPELLAHYAERGHAVTVAELMEGAVQLQEPVEVQPR